MLEVSTVPLKVIFVDSDPSDSAFVPEPLKLEPDWLEIVIVKVLSESTKGPDVGGPVGEPGKIKALYYYVC